MSDSGTLLIGILIALALPVVLMLVGLTVGLAGERRRPPPGTPPPGWYADPLHEAPLRWWDGTRWTPSTHV
jgi:hypothetical protein